jgi:hypothetical protein
MVFSPLSLTEGANASSPFESFQSDNAYNIPIVVPFENDHMLPSVPENVNVESQVGNNEINNSFSTFSTCDKLSVSGVTAIGSDGNVPSNVIDNNLNTRWSNLGKGSWIQLDLGAKKSICSVDIAWYVGNTRQNSFVISVSDDGTTFTNKFSGTSSGTTTSPEKYNMPAGTEGRYVLITVNGNTQNDWASITEIATFGGGGKSNVIGTLFHKWQTSAGSSTWSSYSSLAGGMSPNTNLAVAINGDGRLQGFVVGTNNQLYLSPDGTLRENTDPAVVPNTN